MNDHFAKAWFVTMPMFWVGLIASLALHQIVWALVAIPVMAMFWIVGGLLDTGRIRLKPRKKRLVVIKEKSWWEIDRDEALRQLDREYPGERGNAQ